jgi:hypothetical protein
MNETFFLFYEKENEDIKDFYTILIKNYSLNVKTKSDYEDSTNTFIEAVQESKIPIFCLTNAFVKSEECMKVFDAAKKYKKIFLVIKLEEIVIKNVKLVAVLFDDKKCFDFSKEKDKRSGILYHPRFQDFIKAISTNLDKVIDLKYKECRSTHIQSNQTPRDKNKIQMEGIKKSIRNLVTSIDHILEQVSQMNIQSPVLDKAINFIKNFLLKYLMNIDDASAGDILKISDFSEFELSTKNSSTALVEKLEKLESEMNNLAEQLLEAQNQNVNLIEKLKELESQNAALKAEVDTIKNCVQQKSEVGSQEESSDDESSKENEIEIEDKPVETTIQHCVDKIEAQDENLSAEYIETITPVVQVEELKAEIIEQLQDTNEILEKEITYEIHGSATQIPNEIDSYESSSNGNSATSLESV